MSQKSVSTTQLLRHTFNISATDADANAQTFEPEQENGANWLRRDLAACSDNFFLKMLFPMVPELRDTLYTTVVSSNIDARFYTGVTNYVTQWSSLFTICRIKKLSL
jgi:hypothetical protein